MNTSKRTLVTSELVDLNELIAVVAQSLTRLVGDDIAISTELGPGLDLVRGTRGQFEQALLNLAVNARDAMPNGGRLTIRTGTTVVSTGDARYPDLPQGRYVSLVVADTGCGMTDDVKARIFEPFFTTKAAAKAMGLGLAMVHGVVRSHGGAIAVDSSVGVGTTFELLFPPGDDADTPIVVTA